MSSVRLDACRSRLAPKSVIRNAQPITLARVGCNKRSALHRMAVAGVAERNSGPSCAGCLVDADGVLADERHLVQCASLIAPFAPSPASLSRLSEIFTFLLLPCFRTLPRSPSRLLSYLLLPRNGSGQAIRFPGNAGADCGNATENGSENFAAFARDGCRSGGRVGKA